MRKAARYIFLGLSVLGFAGLWLPQPAAACTQKCQGPIGCRRCVETGIWVGRECVDQAGDCGCFYGSQCVQPASTSAAAPMISVEPSPSTTAPAPDFATFLLQLEDEAAP
jgi:hypothetical protein